jgi:hypothetical protein
MGVEAVVALVVGTVVVLLVPALILSLGSGDRLHNLQSRFQKH